MPLRIDKCIHKISIFVVLRLAGPEGVKVFFTRFIKTFKTNVTVVWGAIARDHSLLSLPA